MNRARLREIAINMAIAIVQTAAHDGFGVGDLSDTVIELLEYLNDEKPYGSPDCKKWQAL